jgi:hypothetical protein
MRKHSIKENSFEAPGIGSINYQTGYGTPASPNTSQNPNSFASSNNNKALGSNSNTAKRIPKAGELDKSVDAMYADPRKATPTPDEVVAGLKYEMGQQIKKDKYEAKRVVIDNLKKDPKFYSGLKMLNIDDQSMVNNMNESKKHPNDIAAKTKVTSNIDETKKIFSEMAAANGKKYVVNSQICDVMKEMWDAKQARRLNK